jgi:hypothetical protein
MSTSHDPGIAPESGGGGGDRLDELLAMSVPVLAQVSDPELTVLVLDARRAAGRASRPPRARRAAVVGAILLAIGAGGAAAAAALSGWVAPWGAQPTGAFTFTLPSGAVCTEQIGPPDGLDAERLAGLRDWFGRTDVMAEADVQARINELRSETDAKMLLEDGTEVDASYGTAYYPSPDEEYQQAVDIAVKDLADAELKRLGREEPLHSWSVERHCPGAK